MKRVIKASQPATSKDYLMQEKEAALKALDEVSYHLSNMKNATGGRLSHRLARVADKTDRLAASLVEVFDTFYGEGQPVQESTAITAEERTVDYKPTDSGLPKGYYDEYYGQTAYEEYGDLVSRECAGMIISKRADEGEEPGGLIYEAERIGIDDFFDLLKCLEGMCYNRKAVEISDYQYKVL